MIVGRNVVVKQIPVGLVEIDPLLDDGLIILMERNALGVVGVRRPDESGLDFEDVILAVAVLIEPFADGVACKHRQGGLRIGPIASIGVDAPIGIVDVADQDLSGLGGQYTC